MHMILLNRIGCEHSTLILIGERTLLEFNEPMGNEVSKTRNQSMKAHLLIYSECRDTIFEDIGYKVSFLSLRMRLCRKTA